MRLGVFGGTFDPPHLGHLIAAQELHHQLGLDRLLLMPASVPPHKRDRQVSPAEIRLEMLRAAVVGDERFEVSELELRREGASYTVDTLRELRAEHPDAELFVAIGADQVSELDTWREPDEIAKLATVVAFARSGQAVPSSRREVRRVEVPELHLSSTLIRARVADGEPVRYMVPAAVERIIRRRGLYGPGG